MVLNNKKIVLGITGSIAAYKSVFLIRLLIKSGAKVKVIMTKSATQFINPLTTSTLSKNQTQVELINPNDATWNNHVKYGLWADIFLIAPATAHTISKMANGLCDNLLIATYLSARCPVMVAPAMDLDMWKHPSNKQNIQKIESYGNIVLPVEQGELASGLEGEGRMAEPENIIKHLSNYFQEK